jgi:5-(carboxyamino)imidazole ribonucleotide synthase
VKLLPGATLGMMGGGQLARMWAHAAQRMGYQTAVLDPDAQSPAGQISHHHIQCAYDDAAGLAQLAALSAAVSTEFENVSAAALQQLAQSLPVAPSGEAVAVTQDRLLEKAHINASAALAAAQGRTAVLTVPYVALCTAQDLAQAQAQTNLFPAILKTARLGYDGKGQITVKLASDLAAAWAQLGQVPCVLEKRMPLQLECSVLVARGFDGQMVHWPLQRNTHVNGILHTTEVSVAPSDQLVPTRLAHQAVQAAQDLAQSLNYVGVLCVEFFVVSADEAGASEKLYVNEMAPRPHNSGHYSMDACDLSQFEAQVRCMAGLPLTQPRLHSPVIMLNLLGDMWFDATGQWREPAWDQVLGLPGVHLHLYGKAEARRGRKMGHLNVTASTLDEVRDQAQNCAKLLNMPPLQLASML